MQGANQNSDCDRRSALVRLENLCRYGLGFGGGITWKSRIVSGYELESSALPVHTLTAGLPPEWPQEEWVDALARARALFLCQLP